MMRAISWLTAFVFAAPAGFAAEVRVWHAAIDEKRNEIVVTDCKHCAHTIALSCMRGSGEVNIRLQSYSYHMSGEFPVRFTVGETTLEYTVEHLYWGIDGINVFVTWPLDHPLLALLSGGPSLTLHFAGRDEEIPLVGAGEAIGELTGYCRAP
jgi:hypothetical protein